MYPMGPGFFIFFESLDGVPVIVSSSDGWKEDIDEILTIICMTGLLDE